MVQEFSSVRKPRGSGIFSSVRKPRGWTDFFQSTNDLFLFCPRGLTRVHISFSGVSHVAPATRSILSNRNNNNAASEVEELDEEV